VKKAVLPALALAFVPSISPSISWSQSPTVQPKPAADDWRDQYAYSVGVQAYIYAGPMLYLTRLRYKWVTDGRAVCSIGGIICNDAAETVYVVAFTDVDGQLLDGANRYTLRFAKDALPPANEFWSLTVYHPAHNLVDNPINRYAIRDRTPGIKQENDGSTILYLQPMSPGAGKEPNWLPTPKQGAFSMALRTYGPGEAITKQTWQPPTVKKMP
jgi:hypothetical protein